MNQIQNQIRKLANLNHQREQRNHQMVMNQIRKLANLNRQRNHLIVMNQKRRLVNPSHQRKKKRSHHQIVIPVTIQINFF